MTYCSIGEAAARFGIPESTLRYYEKKGLLPLIERDDAGRLLFSEVQMTILKVIMHLKHTHMPISTIKQYVDWVIEGTHTTERRLEMMLKHKQAVLDELALTNEALVAIDSKITHYLDRIQPTTSSKGE